VGALGQHPPCPGRLPGYRQAIRHFERAIELDANYPHAWAGLADAHNSIGFVRLYHDYDVEGAESAFRRAIEISPNYAMAHHWRAGALAALDRHDEAIAAAQESLRLDPASLSVMSDLGWYYLFGDRPAEALKVCEDTRKVEPEYGWAKSCRDHALVRMGRTADFLDRFRQQAQANGLPADRLAELSDADETKALAAARRLVFESERKSAESGNADPVWLAMSYAEAGELDGAFDLLERGFAERNPWIVFLRVDPRFDRLAADPRYDDLSRRIGLPGAGILPG
jgi:tetratricopeptide (TPR) repeat protein